jgi:hypothetical protein
MQPLLALSSFLALFTLTNSRPQPLDTFENATIWQAPPSWPDRSTSYARATLLMDGCENDTPPILATWAGSGQGGPYFQIMESDDGGRNWYEISKAYFTMAMRQAEALLEASSCSLSCTSFRKTLATTRRALCSCLETPSLKEQRVLISNSTLRTIKGKSNLSPARSRAS